jgi:hypothetical protein
MEAKEGRRWVVGGGVCVCGVWCRMECGSECVCVFEREEMRRGVSGSGRREKKKEGE